ncbi:MAG: cation transporter [Clostridia bacterium]|nr:cation transporter [Clostridia bacterium]
MAVKNLFLKLKNDGAYRATVAFVISFAVSVIYALYNGIYGILFYSAWFGALALYYIILSVLRGGVVFASRRVLKNTALTQEQRQIKAIKMHLVSGVMIMLLIIALLSAVTLMVIQGEGFKHTGLLIFVAAIYTFYKIIYSIINFVRNKRTEDFVLRTMRNIGLADALVSVLALQTAMLSAFNTGADVRWANAATGGAVCLLIFALGLFMIITSALRLKKTKENEVADGEE